MNLINQPTIAPTRKLKFAMSAGTIVTGIQWAVSTFAPEWVPVAQNPVVVSAITGIVMSITAYFTKNAA